MGDVERAPTARAEEPAPPAPARAPEPAARNGDGAGGAGAGGRLGGAPGSHEVERSLLRVGRRPSPIGNPRALRADVRAARSRAGERARRGRRELDDLLDALPETEEVYELDAAVAHGQDGLLLLTDLRLLFLSGDELLSIPMEAVVKVTASDPAEELIVTAADGLWFRFAEVPGAARFARLIEARSGLRSRPGSSAPGR